MKTWHRKYCWGGKAKEESTKKNPFRFQLDEEELKIRNKKKFCFLSHVSTSLRTRVCRSKNPWAFSFARFVGCRCVVWMKIFILLTSFSSLPHPSIFSQLRDPICLFLLFLLFFSCYRRHHHHLYIVVSPSCFHITQFISINCSYFSHPPHPQRLRYFFFLVHIQTQIFLFSCPWNEHLRERRNPKDGFFSWESEWEKL